MCSSRTLTTTSYICCTRPLARPTKPCAVCALSTRHETATSTSWPPIKATHHSVRSPDGPTWRHPRRLRSVPGSTATAARRREAWGHYRSYVDGEDDEEGGGATGEIDELLEIIEVLSPHSPAPFDPGGSEAGPSLGGAGSLAPVLLSVAHLHLASDAVGRGLGSGNGGDGGAKDEDGGEEGSPERHFTESLRHWPTNPAALSLLANRRRMAGRPAGEVCGLYARAEGCAARWRDEALAFLRRGEEEGADGGEDECIEEEEVVDPREWVELLVLNAALDVEYVGGEDGGGGGGGGGGTGARRGPGPPEEVRPDPQGTPGRVAGGQGRDVRNRPVVPEVGPVPPR
ncbi:hypothetical protein THAOC_00099, partial [Thalassiosira oceanica]